MAATIELERATKLYGQVIGINDVTVALAGGAYGLLGPNGSGKTTFLHLITGQLLPTLGSVRTFGQSPWNNASVLREIGFCPAADVPYTDLEALEWVSYLLKLHGFARCAAVERARASLEKVGLANVMHQPMGTYSRGMRQRAKLAQAFAHDPRLLVLDEPFNGLDPIGRHEMTARIREWTREGKCLLIASHVLHEVEAVADSFLLICGGRLLASGVAEEVRALLADLPHEIRIRCARPAALARLLLDAQAHGVRFEGDGVVVAATRSPAAIYESLPRWEVDADLGIREVRSPDESLQNLFDSLLKIHRGST
jgi:ABC-2 type transport system ATP-binding protein